MRRTLLFLLTVCGWAQTPSQFTITDLGTLPGYGACIATGISPNGKNIAGYCHPPGTVVDSGPATRAFLYSGGTMTGLNAPAGTTVVSGVNDSGTVVGVSLPNGAALTTNLLNGVAVPFISQNGTSQITGTPAPNFWPIAVNNTTVAGFLVNIAPTGIDLSAFAQAATFSGGQTKVLPQPGPVNTFVAGISPQGILSGGTLTINLNALTLSMQPALWKNNVYNSLPAAPQIVGSIASTVNDSGLAGGTAFNIGLNLAAPDRLSIVTLAELHALLWNNGVLTDLNPALGTKHGMVLGVNNSGWAVGMRSPTLPALGILDIFLFPDDPAFRAFVYAGGKVYDLNTMLTNGAGWTLTTANAVNDSGQIVGAGILNGVEHAYLLTPAAANLPTVKGVVGGAFSVPSVSTISANGYFSIGGTNFVPSGTVGTLSASDIVNSSLPTKLASTCVNVGSTRGFLSYVSSTQINVLAPTLPPASTVAVSVVSNCGTPNETTSTPVNVTVAAASPEFLYWAPTSSGQNPVIAVDAVNGDYIGPAGAVAGLNFRPAKAGDVLTLYGISFGPTAGGPAPGVIPSKADSVPPTAQVTIGGKAAGFSYIGVTPGSAGLYQVNLTVPQGLTPGNNAIVLTVNGVNTPTGAFLVVGP